MVGRLCRAGARPRGSAAYRQTMRQTPGTRTSRTDKGQNSKHAKHSIEFLRLRSQQQLTTGVGAWQVTGPARDFDFWCV